jgi:hypothetical protein
MAIRILVYGKSVFIAGIAHILAGDPNLDLRFGNGSNLVDDLPAVDIILADLCEAETLRVLPQLSAKQGSTLVGIDPATSTTTMISGKSQALNSMRELMSFFQSAVLLAATQRHSNEIGEAEFYAPILKTQKEVPRKRYKR